MDDKEMLAEVIRLFKTVGSLGGTVDQGYALTRAYELICTVESNLKHDKDINKD